MGASLAKSKRPIDAMTRVLLVFMKLYARCVITDVKYNREMPF